MTIRAVIISGGSEIVAAAVAEQLNAGGVEFSVISMTRYSILRGIVPPSKFARIDWPPEHPNDAATSIERHIKRWAEGSVTPLVVFPTEDAGLRLCLEFRHLLEPWAVFGRSRVLPKWGGLDKAELFDHLEADKCHKWIAPTRVLSHPDELSQALAVLGSDCVIKPALKPLSMDMGSMPAKAFMTRDYPSLPAIQQALLGAWGLSSTWVVQPRLETGDRGETVIWSVRGYDGSTLLMQAIQKWKYPRFGGTGCWVETQDLDAELENAAKDILRSLDFVGLCELEFLFDVCGRPRLLEVNPRAWLQVGASHKAGLPLALHQFSTMIGEPLTDTKGRSGIRWINLERLLLAIFRREYGSMQHMIRQAWVAFRTADELAIWSSCLRSIRLRWFLRILTAGKNARQ